MNDGSRVFNVRDFGAAGDGKTLDTAPIQSAIDACTANLGGTVLVPAGTFLIAPIELKSNVTLHLAPGATLLATTDIKQYHPANGIPLGGDHTMGDGNTGLVYAANSHHVTIEGQGTIDGQGALVRGGGLGGNHRCHLTLFYKCTNLAIRDVYMFHSCFHTCRICNCDYVDINRLRIFSRVVGNNDGLHFISATHVSVDNTTVRCQDDACALFGSCKFITITNSLFSTRWSAFRFGGGIAENIAVSNCILYQVFGCPIKLRCEPGSHYENMSFSDLLFQEVRGPISLGAGPMRAGGGGRGGGGGNRRPAADAAPDTQPAETPQGNAPPIIRNISFSNLTGTVISQPETLDESTFSSGGNPGELHSCIILNATENTTIENISFTRIHLQFGGGGTQKDADRRDLPQIAGEYYAIGTPPAYGFYARGAKTVTLEDIRFTLASDDLRPAVVLDGVHDARITAITMQANPDADSVLRFQNATDVLVTSPRILGKAKTFLAAEGAKTAAITVEGGDVSGAEAATMVATEVNAKAVRVIGDW